MLKMSKANKNLPIFRKNWVISPLPLRDLTPDSAGCIAGAAVHPDRFKRPEEVVPWQ